MEPGSAVIRTEMVFAESEQRLASTKLSPQFATLLQTPRALRNNTGVPRVSVVLIFLNEERFIEEAVQSVRDQTLTDWELVLVDDGSSDGSTSIARDLAAQDERIRYVEHPGHANRGMAASRNFGVTHTTAPYLAFLDGDDVWVADKLAEQVDLLESMPDVALVNGAVLTWWSWDPASTSPDVLHVIGGVPDRRIDPPEAALVVRPLGRGETGAVDLMVRRNVFEAVGGFEERFRGMFEDQSFLLKVYLRYPIYVSSRAWIFYRRHDASCVAQTTDTAYYRLQRVFLRWLEPHVEQLGNPRVTAALRRAERAVPFRILWAPVTDLYNRVRVLVPTRIRRPVKRRLIALATKVGGRAAAEPRIHWS
jgi:glycosyltransferase involved in cell wall biosynthesis